MVRRIRSKQYEYAASTKHACVMGVGFSKSFHLTSFGIRIGGINAQKAGVKISVFVEARRSIATRSYSMNHSTLTVFVQPIWKYPTTTLLLCHMLRIMNDVKPQKKGLRREHNEKAGNLAEKKKRRKGGGGALPSVSIKKAISLQVFGIVVTCIAVE